MSKENLVNLLKAASKDEQLRKGLEDSESYESFKSLARDRGLEIDDIDEAVAASAIYVAIRNKSEELSEEQLKSVAGGIYVTHDQVAGILPDMDAPSFFSRNQASKETGAGQKGVLPGLGRI